MKLFTFATAFLGALVTVISALPTGGVSANDGTDEYSAPFYITSPLNNAVYTANAIETTTWDNGVPGKFKITVLKGKNAASMHPTRYVYYVEGSDGQYQWKVPEELVGGTYEFHYEFQNGESYSGQFTVAAAEGTTASSPTTTNANSPTNTNSPPLITSAPTGTPITAPPP